MNRTQFIFTLSVALVSGLIGGVLSVWFLMPPSVLAQNSPQKVIEAEAFRLVDANGELRGRFAIEDDGTSRITSLEMFGENGQQNVILKTTDFGMTFLQLENNGGAIAALAVDSQESELELRHAPRNVMVSLSASQEGVPSLKLFDQNTNLRAVLGTTELKHADTGSTEIRAPSSLVLFDEEGNVVWSAP